MSSPANPLSVPGIVWRDTAKVEGLLRRYRTDGKDTLHFVWDWDGTIVPIQGTTWHTMRDILPPEGRAQHVQLYKHYKPLEDNGQLTSALEREWSEKALALHVEYGSQINDLERYAAKIDVRQHTPHVFAVCERAGVPAVILSAGVKNVIAVTAARHGIRPAAILGTELTTQNGTISGWVKDSIVDAQTKREMGHPHIIKVRTHRPNAVLFGDQTQDAGMASGPALRIRINCDVTPGTPEWENYLSESWQAGFDGIITDEDLQAAVQLTHWLITP